MENAPVLNYHFPLENSAETGGWRLANRYHVWTGREAPGVLDWELLEVHGDGFVRRPKSPRSMRRVAAGTPHRIAHLFAPWRVSDADTVHIRMEMDEGTYHTLVVGMGRLVKRDYVLWLCPACGTEMGRAGYDVAAGGMPGFWTFFDAQVREFNADIARRKCPACGALHPVCYGFDAAGATEARIAW